MFCFVLFVFLGVLFCFVLFCFVCRKFGTRVGWYYDRLPAIKHQKPNFKESPEDYEKAEMFHRYVERAQLGFKAFNIRISFSLGVAILTPILSLLSVFVPVFLRQVYSN